jgi:transcriptional regulator with XRE-family HTH domain
MKAMQHEVPHEGPQAMHPLAGALNSGDARALGRSLRTWRAIRRIKQAHAAELLQVSQATVSRWESGHAAPDPEDVLRLRRLMAARLDSASDAVLARLICQSTAPVHLVCDLTHRLLAASPKRAQQFRVPASQLMGTSLWRFASEQIVAAEAGLAAVDWFGPAPPVLEFDTGARESPELVIPAGRMRWVRLRLSDGSHARLVETVPAPADQVRVASPSANTPKASRR